MGLVGFSGLFIHSFVTAGITQHMLTVTINNYTDSTLELGLRNYGQISDQTGNVMGIDSIVIDGSLTIPNGDSLSIPPYTGGQPGQRSISVNQEFDAEEDADKSSSAGFYFAKAAGSATVGNFDDGDSWSDVKIHDWSALDDGSYPYLASTWDSAMGYAQGQSADDPTDFLRSLEGGAPALDVIIGSGTTMVTVTVRGYSERSGSDVTAVGFMNYSNGLMSPDGKTSLVVCASAAGGSASFDTLGLLKGSAVFLGKYIQTLTLDIRPSNQSSEGNCPVWEGSNPADTTISPPATPYLQ